MFKINIKLDIDAQGFEDHFKEATEKATSHTAPLLKDFLIGLAGEKLENGLPLWKDGLLVESIGDDSYMIAISGKLSDMIEDGFSGNELKSLLLNGPRAAHNASLSPNKTKYVDVPFGVSKGKLERGGVQGVKVSQFKNAQEVMQSFTKTDKKGNVGPGKALTKRVGNIIESYGKNTKIGFMTIRRVSAKSQLGSWTGAKILDQNNKIEEFISKQFDVEFDRIF
jgi:hypothetical protein